MHFHCDWGSAIVAMMTGTQIIVYDAEKGIKKLFDGRSLSIEDTDLKLSTQTSPLEDYKNPKDCNEDDDESEVYVDDVDYDEDSTIVMVCSYPLEGYKHFIPIYNEETAFPLMFPDAKNQEARVFPSQNRYSSLHKLFETNFTKPKQKKNHLIKTTLSHEPPKFKAYQLRSRDRDENKMHSFGNKKKARILCEYQFDLFEKFQSQDHLEIW